MRVPPEVQAGGDGQRRPEPAPGARGEGCPAVRSEGHLDRYPTRPHLPSATSAEAIQGWRPRPQPGAPGPGDSGPEDVRVRVTTATRRARPRLSRPRREAG